MDIFTAIKERRSCRNFMSDPVSDDVLEKILEAGTWAPSAANNQPWEFIVVTNDEIKKNIFTESEKCRKILFEKSGWKWVDRYKIGFINEAPVIIAVIGDPQEDRGGHVSGRRRACLPARVCGCNPEHASCGPCLGTGDPLVHPL